MAQKRLLDLTGGEYILEMYRRTKDNQLNLFPDSKKPYFIRVHWTQDSAFRFAVHFDGLVHDLAQIGKVWKQLGKTREENAALLSPKLLEIWDTYIRPPEPQGMDAAQFERIAKQKQKGTPLTFDELLYLALYQQKQQEEMLQRLPLGGVDPLQIHIRACRLTHLYNLNAPPIIINNETRQLANLFIQYYWSPKENASLYPE